MQKLKNSEIKRKNDSLSSNNSNQGMVLIGLGILVLFMTAGIFEVVFGLIGGVFGLVFGLIGGILGLVGGLIGTIFGLVGGLIGTVFGFVGGLIGLIFGSMVVWLPILLIVIGVMALRGRQQEDCC